MKNVTIVFATMAFTGIAGWFAVNGMNYMDMEIGYGLHPAIAFPMATISIVLPFVISHYFQGEQK